MRPFAADDPSLHLVGGQAHRGDGDLRRDLRGDPLDRCDQDVAGATLGRERGLLLDLVDDDLGVALGLVLEALDDELLGFLGGEARNALELEPIALFLAGEGLFLVRGRLESGLEGLFLSIESLYFLIERLFLLLNPALIALELGTSFPYFPFLLVAFSNELIFRLYQDFFLLRFGLFDRVPLNPLRLLLGGGELESGVQPADRPSKNRASKEGQLSKALVMVPPTSTLLWVLIIWMRLILSRIRTNSYFSHL